MIIKVLALFVVFLSAKGLASQLEGGGVLDAPSVGPKRNLLQTDVIDEDYGAGDDKAEEGKEEEEEKKEEPKEEPPKRKTLVTPGQMEKGPTLFYDGNSFMMRVSRPIRVTVFKGGAKESVIELDQSAASVKGGLSADKSDFMVNIDWKGQNFGQNGVKISNIQINMKFVTDNKEYSLESMEIVSMHVDGRPVPSEIVHARTINDYTVKAPMGLSWGCGYPGMFPPRATGEGGGYTFGLTFPEVQLQAFGQKLGNFGPEWTCGEFLPMGVWLGLIFTFFFAMVCYWGFGMLANIQTMDRFDDPKGKSIYVPQTD